MSSNEAKRVKEMQQQAKQKDEQIRKLKSQLQQSASNDDERKDESAEDTENKARLAKAKAHKAFLQNAPDDSRATFKDYEQELVEAQKRIDEIQAALFGGKPIQERLKAQQARHNQLEKQRAREEAELQKAKQASDEALRIVATFEDKVAKTTESIADSAQKMGSLQRESASQHDGKPAKTEAEPQELFQAEQVLELLKQLSGENVTALCQQSNVAPQAMQEAIKLIVATVAKGNVKPQQYNIGETATEHTKVEDIDMADWDDLEFGDESLERISEFVENGFENREGEEPSATKRRLQEWAEGKAKEEKAAKKAKTLLRTVKKKDKTGGR